MSGQVQASVVALHKSAAPGFYVQHKSVDSLCEFFAHNASCNERNGFDSRLTSRRAYIFYRRSDFPGLTGHDASDFTNDVYKFGKSKDRSGSREWIPVVERTARVAESRPEIIGTGTPQDATRGARSEILYPRRRRWNVVYLEAGN